MQIIVTTCQKNLHLLKDFYYLAEKFLVHPIATDVAHKNETKSEQLYRIANTGDDDYIAIMEEDFYLAEEVDIELLHHIFGWCREVEVDRFSLQSKNAHSNPNWNELKNNHVCNNKVYQTNKNVQYPFSLEASVWKKDFLLKWTSGVLLDDGILENSVNQALKIYKVPTKIYALNTMVMTYLDMLRGGNTEIDFDCENNTFYGPEISLYPQGEGTGETRCLNI